MEQDDDDPSAHTSADAILRDFRYKLQCLFMEPQRDLRVGMGKKGLIVTMMLVLSLVITMSVVCNDGLEYCLGWK